MKFYEKTWFIILMLIVFFPVGLFLMWKYTTWNKTAKIIVTVLIAALFISGLGNNKTKDNTVNTTTSADTETVKVDKYEDLKNNAKSILDSKNYYDMNTDERKTVNDLLDEWDKLDDNFKTTYNDLKTQYEKDKYYDNNYKGIIVANVQEEVKKKLKSPKSADFPWGFDEYNISYQGETDDGLYSYTVTSYVDATNSFGAEIRTQYICAISVSKDLSKYRASVIFNE